MFSKIFWMSRIHFLIIFNLYFLNKLSLIILILFKEEIVILYLKIVSKQTYKYYIKTNIKDLKYLS